MMENVSLWNGASLLEDFHGSDDTMQGVNSYIPPMQLNATTLGKAPQRPDLTLSPVALTDGSFRSLLHHDANPFNPSSPCSPVFRSKDKSQQTRHTLYGDDSINGANSYYIASPSTHHNRTSSPVGMIACSPSDGLFYKPSSGNSVVLPPPPTLDASFDGANDIGHFRTGIFLSGHESVNHLDQDPPNGTSLSTPKKQEIVSNGGSISRDRSFSSPGIHTRQLPIGVKPMTPPSSKQVLYESKPSSWSEGQGILATSVFRSEATLSPNVCADRFSYRPPRYGGNRDVSFHSDLRHVLSDGIFDYPGQQPLSTHMNTVPTNENNLPPQTTGMILVGPKSSDASFQHDSTNNHTYSFAGVGMDAFNPNANKIQDKSELGLTRMYCIGQDNESYGQVFSHTRSPSLPPPGFVKNGIDCDQNVAIRHGHHCLQNAQLPSLHRHHSTGSEHFLVNEKGLIVGRTNSVIPQSSPDFFIQNAFNGVHTNFRSFPNAPPFQDEASKRKNMSAKSGRTKFVSQQVQHQRHHTEPTISNIDHNFDGNLYSRSIDRLNDDFEHALAGENIEGLDEGLDEEEEFSRSPRRTDFSENMIFSTLSKPSESTSHHALPPQLLTAGASISKSRPKMVYNVKFKRSQRNFILGEHITRDIKIGCYVKVEADRGEDLGIVFSIVPMDKFLISNRSKVISGDEDISFSSQGVHASDLKRIMRVATNDEISLLEVKHEEEEDLLKICRTKAHQRGLPMTVVDAEYQFDRHKLTFFFEAQGRIDFRELVRDLFSMYKTRIWMQQLDKDRTGKEEGDGKSINQ